MEKQLRIKSKLVTTPEQAAEQISELALGLAHRELTIGEGENRYRISPGDVVKIQLKGKEDAKEGKLTIEVTWKPDLIISASQAS